MSKTGYFVCHRRCWKQSFTANTYRGSLSVVSPLPAIYSLHWVAGP